MNTTVLSVEVATAVGELKAKPGRELQVHGSGALFRWLLDNDLVDEMTLFTFPVVVGQGTRLFPDTGPDRAFDLVEARATPRGVTIQVCPKCQLIEADLGFGAMRLDLMSELSGRTGNHHRLPECHARAGELTIGPT